MFLLPDPPTRFHWTVTRVTASLDLRSEFPMFSALVMLVIHRLLCTKFITTQDKAARMSYTCHLTAYTGPGHQELMRKCYIHECLISAFITKSKNLIHGFVCWFVWGFRPTREFLTDMETSPLPVNGCKFWPIFSIHDQWTVGVL